MLAVILFSSIPLLHENQGAGSLQINNSQSKETTPLILNITTNLWDQWNGGEMPRYSPNHEVYVTTIVEYADTCILSYKASPGPYAETANWTATNWINETMTKNGNSYNGTIPGGMPYLARVNWKIYANDQYGHSITTDEQVFNCWIDP